MIKVLHGENIVESRKVLTSLLEKARGQGVEVVTLSAPKITLTEIRNALESNSLLAKNRLVVIENFFSSPKTKERSKIVDYLTRGKFDNDLIFWEEKEIKTQLTGAESEIFKINPVIFRFLESLRPGSPQEMLWYLAQVKLTEEPEMIFNMLVRQFRFLILAKEVSGLSELPSWQQKKFLHQSAKFTGEQLKDIYKKLLEIDFRQKTSGDVFSLSSRLDLFISSL